MDIKLSSELNVALDTSDYLREKSKELDTGYNSETNTWTLIIRYIGDLETIISEFDGIGTELLGGFGIISIKQDRISDLALDNRIIYIEKPKIFVQGRANVNGFIPSCMSVPYFDMGLRGKGITVAVIDSGIDIFHPDFILESSDDNILISKVVGIWDQSIYGNPPNGYNIGTFFENNDINNAINSEDKSFISQDISSHGTGVAGIVASCTPEAGLLIVKLDTAENEQADTINLMLAIDFSVRYSIDNNIPMVVNLSYGNNSGDHNGNSILERYIDEVAGLAKITIVVGAGNDAASGRHIQINMGNDSFYNRDFQVSKGEGSISIQIWKDLQDIMDVFLRTPAGDVVGPFNDYGKIMSYNVNNMNIKVLITGPTPINIRQETYISIIPIDEFIEEGVWSISFNPKSIINGRVDAWLPVQGSTNTDIFFLVPNEGTTITIPSTADNIISVGAYDSNLMIYADFSGRGYTVDGIVKPDLVAPGVDIDVPNVGGGYRIVSGTSFSAPFVSSAAAMLMEYGIVNNNDTFLYGEKVKAYLISGAIQLSGIKENPNTLTGWGALCVENSLPE